MEGFLAHHGVQGMKWGVHNEETKMKYGEIPSGGGGGGGSDDKEQSPEELLKKGLIDEKTAKKMRADLDAAISKLEDGKIAEEAYLKAVNNAYKSAGLSSKYSSSDISKARAKDDVEVATGKSVHSASKNEQLKTIADNAKVGAKTMIEARKSSGTGSSIVNAVVRKAAGTAHDVKSVNRAYDD